MAQFFRVLDNRVINLDHVLTMYTEKSIDGTRERVAIVFANKETLNVYKDKNQLDYDDLVTFINSTPDIFDLAKGREGNSSENTGL